MLVLGRSFFQSRILPSAAEAMKYHEIVHDVIDKGPVSVAEVIYPSGAKASLGNELTPTQVKKQPSIKWKADDDAFYTVCMLDPDAPSREDPKFREWHHWLVGNVPQNKLRFGEVLSEYIGSAPPPGTGLHRYVFLVYKQGGKIDFKCKRLTNKSRENRAGFSIRKFAAKYKLGEPVAGNFYQAEYDDYVPIIYRQLGI